MQSVEFSVDATVTEFKNWLERRFGKRGNLPELDWPWAHDGLFELLWLETINADENAATVICVATYGLYVRDVLDPVTKERTTVLGNGVGASLLDVGAFEAIRIEISSVAREKSTVRIECEHPIALKAYKLILDAMHDNWEGARPALGRCRYDQPEVPTSAEVMRATLNVDVTLTELVWWIESKYLFENSPILDRRNYVRKGDLEKHGVFRTHPFRDGWFVSPLLRATEPSTGSCSIKAPVYAATVNGFQVVNPDPIELVVREARDGQVKVDITCNAVVADACYLSIVEGIGQRWDYAADDPTSLSRWAMIAFNLGRQEPGVEPSAAPILTTAPNSAQSGEKPGSLLPSGNSSQGESVAATSTSQPEIPFVARVELDPLLSDPVGGCYGTCRDLTIDEVRQIVAACLAFKLGGKVPEFHRRKALIPGDPKSYELETLRGWLKNPKFAPKTPEK